jgi:hypothetical protein
MLMCRWLVERGTMGPCLKLINGVVEELLRLYCKIRVGYENIEKSEHISVNKKIYKNRKNKYYLKKVIKMLLLALIVMIRANLKLGH